MKTIPVFRPAYDDEEIAAVTEVLKSGWVGLGPKTAELEKNFALYTGARYAVAMNSCTAALHLALASLGLKPGDEVITTSITFVSSAHAIAYSGAKPVFADVEPDTLNLDPKSVEKMVTRHTKAILCVHYGGHPCDIAALEGIAKAHNIPLIEDAAHACGAQYKGTKIGGTGNITCFSFHAVKNLACGDGGMVTMPAKKTDEWLRKMNWLGINKTTWGRSADKKYSWNYDVEMLGFKCHTNDILASIALVQLKKLDKHNLRRRHLAERYIKGLADLDWLTMPVEREYASSSWHICKVETDKPAQRDTLVAYMKKNGVALGVHYYPVHLQRFYSEGSKKIHLPVAEEKWQKIASLPMYPDLTDEEQDRVIELIRNMKV